MTAGAERKALRQTIRTAIRNAPAFVGWTELKSWAQSVDPDMMPVIGLMTPREDVEGLDGDTLRRSTTFAVHFAILGADSIEDDLDDTADAVETLVYATLKQRDMPLYSIQNLDFEIKDAGGQRMGSATLTFSETRFSPEP